MLEKIWLFLDELCICSVKKYDFYSLSSCVCIEANRGNLLGSGTLCFAWGIMHVAMDSQLHDARRFGRAIVMIGSTGEGKGWMEL